jgi:hypothetical protein
LIATSILISTSCQSKKNESAAEGLISLKNIWPDPSNIPICLVNDEILNEFPKIYTDFKATIRKQFRIAENFLDFLQM